MRMLRNLGIALALLWLAFCGLMYREMRLPPDRFAAFMAKLPDAVFLFAPFETLWSHAREGALKPGDEAPDFDLRSLDGNTRVALRSFRGKQPVTLIFGSYT